MTGRLVRHGDGSVCLLAVGKMVEVAEGAADLLAHRGHRRDRLGRAGCRPTRPEMLADAASALARRDDRRRHPHRWSGDLPRGRHAALSRARPHPAAGQDARTSARVHPPGQARLHPCEARTRRRPGSRARSRRPSPPSRSASTWPELVLRRRTPVAGYGSHLSTRPKPVLLFALVEFNLADLFEAAADAFGEREYLVAGGRAPHLRGDGGAREPPRAPSRRPRGRAR